MLELDEIAHTAAEYGGGWAGYLELRATAARHAEERYETYTAQRDRLTDRARAPAPVVGDRRAQAPRASAHEPDKNVRAPRAPSAPRSRRPRSRATEKAIERLETVDKPWRRWELQLRFGGGERSGDVTVRLERRRAAARRASCSARSTSSSAWGERVALVGPNGSGKTTLVDGLLGRLPLAAGTRWVGPGVRIGDARPGARAASTATRR